MEFRNWLESSDDIKFGGWFSDGTVIVYISGKRYVYRTDPVYHYEWKRQARFAPFRVLNQIKSASITS